MNSGRGWKSITSTSIENMTTELKEGTSSGVQTCCVWGIVQFVDKPVRMMFKILLNFLHCYPYKTTHIQLFPDDLTVRHAFALEFLARMEVEHFVGRCSPLLFPKLCQYTNMQDTGNGKTTRTCISTASFSKGSSLVLVDNIVYCRSLFFDGFNDSRLYCQS